MARVSPAFKGKGDINDETHFRPLSVIGHLAKMSEMCVHKQLTSYLLTHRLISIDQFAYLKQHSTQTSLHRLVDDILENINEKENTGLCFLDIKKCFDTIDHNLLLFKLNKYGIKGNELAWFKSYLTNRTQVVTFNNKVSSKKLINIGVPQGTILGPILFLIYVNDLSNCVRNAHVNIYADDVVIYTSNNNINILQSSLQDTLNSVYEWYNKNRLILSIDKCASMLINN